MNKKKEEVVKGEVIVETIPAMQTVVTTSTGENMQLFVDPANFAQSMNSSAPMITFNCVDGAIRAFSPTSIARIEAKRTSLRVEPTSTQGDTL